MNRRFLTSVRSVRFGITGVLPKDSWFSKSLAGAEAKQAAFAHEFWVNG